MPADGNGVSYEMSLAAIFRAMGDEMPEEFGVFYLYDRPKPDAPGLSKPDIAIGSSWRVPSQGTGARPNDAEHPDLHAARRHPEPPICRA